MPSYTEILPSASPDFRASDNGGLKRKRIGNAEEGFLRSSHGRDTDTSYKTTFASANLRRISSSHESSGQQLNSDPTDLPVLDQIFGHWVPADNAIHKRQRRSDTPTSKNLPINDDEVIYKNTNFAPTYSQEALSYPHYLRSHNLRTTSSPNLSTYNAGIREKLSHSIHIHTEMSTLDQLQLQAQMQLPCHICHKRPRYKDELNRFIFCQECGERTCNICVRECFNGLVDESILDDARFDMEYSDNHSNQNCHQDGNQEEGSYGYRTLPINGIDDRGRPNTDISEREFNYKGHKRSVLGDKRDNGGAGIRRSRHKERICSMCCVEKGEEGEVFCVGCMEEECL